MARIIQAFTQFFDDAGNPLVNGKLRFFESGTNNTDKDTFADSALTIMNSNPVLLDGAGRCPNIFGDGAYNVISYTADDVQIQQFDPVGAVNTGGAFEPWVSTDIYGEGDIVSYEGEYYRSLESNNQNNNPASSSASWEQLELGRIYNPTVNYSVGDNVYASDGLIYVSLKSSNSGNDPVIDDGSNWVSYDQPRFAVATGTGDAQSVSFDIDIPLRDGVLLYVSSSGGNTVDNPTIEINGSTKTIVKGGNSSLLVNDIPTSGYVMQLIYRTGNDNVELINPSDSKLTSAAWVNFNASSGTPVIQDSENVLSITDRGAGLFTIVIDNDFANTGYAVVFGGPSVDSGNSVVVGYDFNTPSKTVGEYNIAVFRAGAARDDDDISVVFFGELA